MFDREEEGTAGLSVRHNWVCVNNSLLFMLVNVIMTMMVIVR